MCSERVLPRMIDMRKGTASCSLYIGCGGPGEEQLSKAATAIRPEACSKGRTLEVVEQSTVGIYGNIGTNWGRMFVQNVERLTGREIKGGARSVLLVDITIL